MDQAAAHRSERSHEEIHGVREQLPELPRPRGRAAASDLSLQKFGSVDAWFLRCVSGAALPEGPAGFARTEIAVALVHEFGAALQASDFARDRHRSNAWQQGRRWDRR